MIGKRRRRQGKAKEEFLKEQISSLKTVETSDGEPYLELIKKMGGSTKIAKEELLRRKEAEKQAAAKAKREAL